MISIEYLVYAVANATLLLAFSRVTDILGSTQYKLLKYFPLYPGVVVTGLLGSIIFLYIGMKIVGRSRKWWLIGMVSILVLPIIIRYSILEIFGKAYFQSIDSYKPYQWFPSSLTEGFNNFGNSLVKNVNFNVVLVLLLINYKKFTINALPLTKTLKRILIIFISLLLIPILLFLPYAYIKSRDTDLGYTQAQKSVSFHIYRPTYLPENYTQLTAFNSNLEFANRQNAVRVAYDFEYFKNLKDKRSHGFFVVSQINVDDSFDVLKFTMDSVKDKNKETVKEVTIAKAKDNTGYIRYLSGDNKLMTLNFISNDNVLIQIATVIDREEDAISVANSMQ